MSRGKLMCALAVAVAAFVCGCAAFWRAEQPIADCTKRVLDDAAQGMGLEQIIHDMQTVSHCAMDAAAIVAILSESQTVASSVSYGQAKQYLAAHAPQDGGVQ